MTSSEAASSSSKAGLPLVEETKKKESLLPPHITTYFIAGGIAGAASRTVVSPLERLKIIQYVAIFYLVFIYTIDSMGSFLIRQDRCSRNVPVLVPTMEYTGPWSGCGRRKASEDS